MGELVLLIVAAAWAAVLLPPLLRSRFENRPNSSVTDFNRQLARLQGSVPSRTTTSMRSAARPLAGSQVAAQSRRDAAAARRPKVHGSPSLEGVQTPRQPMSAAEVQRRRRANVFVGLLVTTVCLLFLAATTKEVAMLYLFAMSFLSLFGYVYFLVSMRQRPTSWGPAAQGDDWLRR
ncbi:MAG: hypothetical protein CL445_08680 [Acidimicrobiaceae bacterium]|nr:hypothetical protein [Acidimicrobiaceae bacterium]